MPEPDATTERAGAELVEIAVLMAERSRALTEELVRRFGERIPELPDDPTLVALLEGSTGSNLETLTHVLRGHVPIADIHAPAAAVEYAHRLAQRGTTPSALLRAYRLGQQLVLAWASDEIARRVPDRDVALATTQLLTETSFRYIDAVSEDVFAAYQRERERWLAHRNAVRRETVDRLLAGERFDLAAAEASLGYRLRQHHVGLVLWAVGDHGIDLSEIERTAGRIAHALGVPHPLFVPRDRETAWAWLPAGRTAAVDPTAIDTVLDADADGDAAGVGVAVGQPAPGESGFRSTHLGAVAAQQVALLGRHPAGRAISYADPTVRAAALIGRDLPAARDLVATALGDLAEDSRAMTRQRETLLSFLQERESYVATAARMHLHRNTVKYRIDRAIEARGRPLGEERLDLELALIACTWLGPEVLRKNGRAPGAG